MISKRRESLSYSAILKLVVSSSYCIYNRKNFPVHLGGFSIDKGFSTLREKIVHSAYCS